VDDPALPRAVVFAGAVRGRAVASYCRGPAVRGKSILFLSIDPGLPVPGRGRGRGRPHERGILEWLPGQFCEGLRPLLLRNVRAFDIRKEGLNNADRNGLAVNPSLEGGLMYLDKAVNGGFAAYEDGFTLLELTRNYYRGAGLDVRLLDLLVR